ncbi:dimethylallyltransferase [Deinococcus aerius]|uniref:Dimethylallyltransferase n=1 Tax=Deinococcus aerius TaxID=200253 RepID=A0A2I9D166_9DEIO|nr:dimethylallyltransferase [Deinococcus aerius]
MVTVKAALLEGTQGTLGLLRLTKKGNDAFHRPGFTTPAPGEARDKARRRPPLPPHPLVFWTAFSHPVAGHGE